MDTNGTRFIFFILKYKSDGNSNAGFPNYGNFYKEIMNDIIDNENKIIRMSISLIIIHRIFFGKHLFLLKLLGFFNGSYKLTFFVPFSQP